MKYLDEYTDQISRVFSALISWSLAGIYQLNNVLHQRYSTYKFLFLKPGLYYISLDTSEILSQLQFDHNNYFHSISSAK